jgi:hypothetical protein
VPCLGRTSSDGSSVEHWLLGQLAGKGQLVRSLGDGKLLAVAVWSSTLLGPEGTGVESCLSEDRDNPSWMRRVLSRGRPYLENCIVDASINCSRQVDKGARWMPWHQEPMKDVGACDKPRGVGNQTVIRGFPNRETCRA